MSYKTDSKILYHLCDDLLPSVLKKYIITQDDYNKIEETKKV